MNAHRVGDLNSGHDDCDPVELVTGSGDVFVNGRRAGRLGDSYGVHSCEEHLPHAGQVATSSATVFINGRGAARRADAVTCGGAALQGSPDVWIGD